MVRFFLILTKRIEWRLIPINNVTPNPHKSHPSPEDTKRKAKMICLSGKHESTFWSLIFLPWSVLSTWAANSSPEPLTGQASGMVPMPQQRPGLQQHCILVILPGSSLCTAAAHQARKHVPALWSKHGKENRRHDRIAPESSHHLLYTLGDAKLRGLFYLISITAHSFHFYHIYLCFCLFTHWAPYTPYPRYTKKRGMKQL